MIIKLTLTDDILSLLSNIRFKELPDLSSKKFPLNWGIDFFSMYGGSYLLEDISRIIGRYDEHIKGTEEDPMGPQFPKELEEYMFEMHEFIMNNIDYLEDLIHYYSNKGGLTPGTYKCKSNVKDWKKID